MFFSYILLFDVVTDKSKQITESHGKDNIVEKYLSSILCHALSAESKAKAWRNPFELSKFSQLHSCQPALKLPPSSECKHRLFFFFPGRFLNILCAHMMLPVLLFWAVTHTGIGHEAARLSRAWRHIFVLRNEACK